MYNVKSASLCWSYELGNKETYDSWLRGMTLHVAMLDILVSAEFQLSILGWNMDLLLSSVYFIVLDPSAYFVFYACEHECLLLYVRLSILYKCIKTRSWPM